MSRFAISVTSWSPMTFDPTTFKSRPAINTAVSPVKVEALACSQSLEVMVCVVLDDRKRLVL
ncbi:hypothetical protein A3839_26725 [Achromobacter insolitus]|nr:hypothetical protein A3839_26725 [Achromobacter insolitus]